MIVVAKLDKPYTSQQRVDFVVTYNHNQGLLINETISELQALDYTEEEKAQQRQENFYNEFLATPLGNYRLQPKGYANAQQSIDTVNGIVNVMGGLTEQIASLIIFYETPDFTDESQCSEEWLIQHQHNPQPMTKEEWNTFYITFTTLYAQKQYESKGEEE